MFGSSHLNLSYFKLFYFDFTVQYANRALNKLGRHVFSASIHRFHVRIDESSKWRLSRFMDRENRMRNLIMILYL